MKTIRWALLSSAVVLLLGATAWAGPEIYEGFSVVKVIVNGRLIQGDVPAIMVGGRTMLPLRATADALGATVEWDAQSQTAMLTTSEPFGTDVDYISLQAELLKVRSELAVAQAEIARLKGLTVTTPGPVSNEPKVEVVSHNIRKDRVGSTWVSVELKNTGAVPIADIQVSMTAIKSGVLVATGNDSLGVSRVLKPNETASLRLKPSNDIPEGAEVLWNVSSSVSSKQVVPVAVTARTVTRGDFGWAHAIGTVRNDTQGSIKDVYIIATFHDANGKIIYSSPGFAALRELKPGQVSTFDLTAYDVKFEDVAEVTVYVSASPSR